MLKAHDRAIQTLEDPASVAWPGRVEIPIDNIDPEDATKPRGGGSKVGATNTSVRRITVPGAAVGDSLPHGSPGEIVVLQFRAPGTQPKGSFNLRMADDYHHGVDALLMLAWDGVKWIEQSRTGGARTLLNVTQFGALGDGTRCDQEVQNAIDTLELMGQGAGGVIFFPKSNLGDYVFMDTVRVRYSNVEILLEDGVIIRKQSDDNLQCFNVAPELLESSRTTVTATITEKDLTLTVASGDEANFSAGDWVLIEDDETNYDGGAQIHSELARVRSTADTVITLYWPVMDTYSTATRHVTRIMPRANSATLISGNGLVGFTMRGRGTIKNYTGDGLTVGGAGLRLQYCHDVLIDGVRFSDCHAEGFTAIQSNQVKVVNCHFQNARIFSGSHGYGITTGSSTNVLVENCTFERNRHSIDFSYWSQNCTAIGNHIRASGATSIITHPNTRGISILGNTIDGAAGMDDATGDGNELIIAIGGGNSLASGISLGEDCQYAMIAYNHINNASANGIWILPDNSDFILVEHNIIRNPNAADLTSTPYGGIRCIQHPGAAPTIDRDAIIIRNNIISGAKRVGIIAGVNNLRVEGNHVYNTSSGPGIAIRPFAAGGGGATQTVSYVYVTGNFVDTTSGLNAHGIVVGDSDGSIDHVVVADNFVTRAEDNGIAVTNVSASTFLAIKDNYLIGNNTANSSTQAAILVEEEPGGEGVDHETHLVAGNVIWGDNRNGIIVGLSYARVVNNYIIDESTIGIWVNNVHTAGPDVVRGVVVEGNDVYLTLLGIYVGPGSGSGVVVGTLVKGNRCVQQSRYGIEVRAGSADTILEGNYVDANGSSAGYDGIQITSGTGCLVRNNIMIDTGSTPQQDYGLVIEAAAVGTIVEGNFYRDNQLGPFSDSGTGTIWQDEELPATIWGVDPAEADNTTEMQAAIDGCPDGVILKVPPGTYNFTAVGGLSWDSTADGLAGITAYGATFDWGTTALTDHAFKIRSRTGGYFLKGLNLTRTYGAAPTGSKHTGLRLIGCQRFTVEDCKVSFFRYAIELVGGDTEGCTDNQVLHCHTTSAWRHLYLHPGTDAGWCNQNYIEGHRTQQSITDATERQSIDALVTIEYEAAASHNPNNNTFYMCSFESTGTIEGGIRVEGLANNFLMCRLEGLDAADVPIEIGNGSYAASSFARNVFLYCHLMEVILRAEAITFTDSGATGVNTQNVFVVPKALQTPVASPFTIDRADKWILVDATAENITVNLPAAAGHKHESYYIKKIDASANTVTVDGNGAETIDDAATYVISTQYECIEVVSDGSEWWII
jgi:hypothetical protein